MARKKKQAASNDEPQGRGNLRVKMKGTDGPVLHIRKGLFNEGLYDLVEDSTPPPRKPVETWSLEPENAPENDEKAAESDD